MPIISNDIYRQLLILKVRHPTKRVTVAPEIQKLTTPLVTKFEKWSGKKKKLLFKDETHIASCGIRNFALNNNIFAQMLASPLRSERNCKTKMPKEFLMQLKLCVTQKDNSSGCSRPLKLSPTVLHSKVYKNSYVVNSRELILQRINSSSKWIPFGALTSQMRFFQLQDVFIDRSRFLSHYENYLNSLLRENLINASACKLELQYGDIIVGFEKENNKPIEIKRYPSTDGKDMELVTFNLKSLGPSWEQFVSKHRNHESRNIVLRFSENREAVKLLYRMLAYHYT